MWAGGGGNKTCEGLWRAGIRDAVSVAYSAAAGASRASASAARQMAPGISLSPVASSVRVLRSSVPAKLIRGKESPSSVPHPSI